MLVTTAYVVEREGFGQRGGGGTLPAAGGAGDGDEHSDSAPLRLKEVALHGRGFRWLAYLAPRQ